MEVALGGRGADPEVAAEGGAAADAAPQGGEFLGWLRPFTPQYPRHPGHRRRYFTGFNVNDLMASPYCGGLRREKCRAFSPFLRVSVTGL